MISVYRVLFVIASVNIAQNNVNSKCVQRDYGNGGTVCVCNTEGCDQLPVIEKLNSSNYQIFTSNKDGLRFERAEGAFIKDTPANNEENVISIGRQSYQKMIGWGGAFTDAACQNILSMDKNLQEAILNSYFSKSGLDYNLCRVPMGGTDFSTHAYSYADGPEDKTLSNFSLAEEDFKLKIPIVKRAINMSESNLKLFTSTWTAPKWMKFNDEYAGMFGFLKSEMYQTWADYFVKFLDSYSEQGINFWGITTGNEPSLALTPAKINSVAWFSSQMRKFIGENLGPTLRNSKHKDIKLMALDDQRLFLPWYLDLIFLDETVLNYVDGIAVHWYTNGAFSPNLLNKTHDHFPNKFLLATEACEGSLDSEPAVILGSWQRGENYAKDIIQDVNNYVTGWIDWNLVLDETGGPTYIGNNVDSPILVNATGGEFYKQPMYYALGHFSKFVPEDSVRIQSEQSNDDLLVVAFKRPDDGIVVEILNTSEDVQNVVIADEEKGNIQLNITSKSLTTLLYW